MPPHLACLSDVNLEDLYDKGLIHGLGHRYLKARGLQEYSCLSLRASGRAAQQGQKTPEPDEEKHRAPLGRFGEFQLDHAPSSPFDSETLTAKVRKSAGFELGVELWVVHG